MLQTDNDVRDELFQDFRVAATSDVREARAALGSVLQSRQMLLDKSIAGQPLDLTLNALSVGEVTLTYVRIACDVRMKFETENFHVHVPLYVASDSRRGERERAQATPGRGAVFLPGRTSEVDWHGGSAQLCLIFPHRAVRLHLEAMLGCPVREPIEFAPVMDFGTERGEAWLATVRMVERHARCVAGLLDHAQAVADLERILIFGLLVAQPHNYLDALTRSRAGEVPSAVRDAIELMQSHPERPWTTQSLARETAVSVRCLQEGFRRSSGVPPMRYLRDLRLNRVHDDLRSATPDLSGVGQIARRWGFLYHGRFAAEYREKFGQAPSETLRTSSPLPSRPARNSRPAC
jgi:AraC-like DNA-binding protein